MRVGSGNHFSIFVNRSLSANCSSIFYEVRNRPSLPTVVLASFPHFCEEPPMNYSSESAFPTGERKKESQMRFSNFELLQSFSSLSGKLAVPIFSSFVFKAQQKCPKLWKVFAAEGRNGRAGKENRVSLLWLDISMGSSLNLGIISANRGEWFSCLVPPLHEESLVHTVSW